MYFKFIKSSGKFTTLNFKALQHNLQITWRTLQFFSYNDACFCLNYITNEFSLFVCTASKFSLKENQIASETAKLLKKVLDSCH